MRLLGGSGIHALLFLLATCAMFLALAIELAVLPLPAATADMPTAGERLLRAIVAKILIQRRETRTLARNSSPRELQRTRQRRQILRKNCSLGLRQAARRCIVARTRSMRPTTPLLTFFLQACLPRWSLLWSTAQMTAFLSVRTVSSIGLRVSASKVQLRHKTKVSPSEARPTRRFESSFLRKSVTGAKSCLRTGSGTEPICSTDGRII